LTQLYNKLVIYNLKRHGLFKLGNKVYNFRRPNRGFPNVLTPEFLLVDLLNNLDELAEDSAFVKEHALTYGKVATKCFFNEVFN